MCSRRVPERSSGRRRRAGWSRCPWAAPGRRARRRHGRGGCRHAGWHRRLRVNARRMSSPGSDKSEKTRRVPSPMDAVLGEDATEVGAGRGAMLSPENGRAVATDAKVCGGGDAALRGQTPSASSMVSRTLYIKKHATDTMFLIRFLYDDPVLKGPPNF